MKTKIVLAILPLFLLLAVPAFADNTKPNRLPEGNLRACVAKQSAVKNRMASLTALATNIVSKFDLIATRVEDYYTLKVLPTGKTVPNYNALVADIATKKAIVNTDLALARNRVNSFSCSGNDPRGLLAQFRVDMQKVKSDLQDYRTSIKNLIVAVRPLAPKDDSTRGGSR